MYLDKREMRPAFRVGIAGPVSHSKTALLACFYKWLWPAINMAVIAHHIYPQKDMEYLLEGILPNEHIFKLKDIPIRENVEPYLEAVEHLENTISGLELIFIESNDDNSVVSFGLGVIDAFIYVIDSNHSFLYRGEPGVTRADFLIVNQIDEAVSTSISPDKVKEMRGDRPFIFTSLKDNASLDEILAWLDEKVHSPSEESTV